jgi:hypothetical protein
MTLRRGGARLRVQLPCKGAASRSYPKDTDETEDAALGASGAALRLKASFWDEF